MWDHLKWIFVISASYFDLQLSPADSLVKWKRIWKFEKSNESVGHDTRFSTFFRENNLSSAEILLKNVIFKRNLKYQRKSAFFSEYLAHFRILVDFQRNFKISVEIGWFSVVFLEKTWNLTMLSVKIWNFGNMLEMTYFLVDLAFFRIIVEIQPISKLWAEITLILDKFGRKILKMTMTSKIKFTGFNCGNQIILGTISLFFVKFWLIFLQNFLKTDVTFHQYFENKLSRIFDNFFLDATGIITEL